jgi:AcrR family transcriptional regulator
MAQALRDRQMELTRDLILEALGGLIAEGHLAEFSVQDVADGAGVALRTVYRHFASRDELLEAFVPWAEQRFRAAGGFSLPENADDISAYVKAKFAAMERFASLLSAVVKLDAATRVRSEVSARSVAAMGSALAEVTSDLDPRLAEAVVWTIRQICSNKTWLVLHEEGGIDAEYAGSTAAWVVELLLAALRQGRVPQIEERGRR